MKNLKMAIEHAERQAKVRETEEGFLGDIPTSQLVITSSGRYKLSFSPDETKQVVVLLEKMFAERNVKRDKAVERLNLVNELYVGGN